MVLDLDRPTPEVSVTRRVVATTLMVGGALLSGIAGSVAGDLLVGLLYVLGTVGVLGGTALFAFGSQVGRWVVIAFAAALIVLGAWSENPWLGEVVVLAGAAVGTGTVPRAERRWMARLAWIALGLHGLVGVMIAFTGLLAPPVGVVLTAALWGAGTWLLVRLRGQPGWSLAVPIGTAILWGVVLALGDVLLGWTA